MKALFFDCSSGISGNMVLGALTELIGDEKYLVEELKKLNIEGYSIEYSKKIKNGISGTHVDVILKHSDEHSHFHRNLNDINHIIDGSSLNDFVKDLSKRIFYRVAMAESKVHALPVDKVHFHEVGAVDSIVDIVGTAILMDKIKPERIYSGIINDGYGFIECAHGKISVPVPATSEIFAKGNVTCRQIDIDTELVTPTGAAIITELASSYGPMPSMTVCRIGYGAGTKDLAIPNILKVTLGIPDEEVLVMETNIDDCTGEILAYTLELLLDAGALDAFYTPIYMKKNRPAYMLTVICNTGNMLKLQDIIFRETTTIGIRMRTDSRAILKRENVNINTPYGELCCKKVYHGDTSYIYPEYESAREVAQTGNIPLKDVYKWNSEKY